jgi:hypothetical protein
MKSLERPRKKSMHLRPYKFTIIQQLHPPDYLQKIQFCNWYKNNLLDNVDQQDITFFSAGFSHHAYGSICLGS